MSTIWDAVTRFFGPSRNNTRFAELMQQLAGIAVECAAHFKKTGGRDLRSIVDFEHRADDIVRAIHELLDNAFILRFDIPDSMELTDELDNVIDGMRKVATHLDIYQNQIKELKPDAAELIAIGERMVQSVHDLIAMLSEPRLTLSRVREGAKAIDLAESEADQLVADAERRIVAEYSPPHANRLEFLAWQKLYQLLEQVTDDANHCARLILSLARKEA